MKTSEVNASEIMALVDWLAHVLALVRERHLGNRVVLRRVFRQLRNALDEERNPRLRNALEGRGRETVERVRL